MRIVHFNEMANLRQIDTNCSTIIWIGTKLSSSKHNDPRIKFQNNKSTNIDPSNLIPISIEDEPKLEISNVKLNVSIEDIKKWIILNKDILLEYWNCEISTTECLNKLKKL